MDRDKVAIHVVVGERVVVPEIHFVIVHLQQLLANVQSVVPWVVHLIQQGVEVYNVILPASALDPYGSRDDEMLLDQCNQGGTIASFANS